MDDFSERLIEQYFDRVHAYVRLRAPEQDCEDIVADIFLRAIERREQLRADAGSWLFAIARSCIADYFRDRRGLVMSIQSTQETPTTAPASVSLEPLQRLERSEFNERLLRQINRLSELEREVIAFKFTDGLTNVEIAQMLKITPNHLGVVLHRALIQLRAAMLEEDLE